MLPTWRGGGDLGNNNHTDDVMPFSLSSSSSSSSSPSSSSAHPYLPHIAHENTVVLVYPHPSGVSHFWNVADNRRRAQRELRSAMSQRLGVQAPVRRSHYFTAASNFSPTSSYFPPPSPGRGGMYLQQQQQQPQHQQNRQQHQQQLHVQQRRMRGWSVDHTDSDADPAVEAKEVHVPQEMEGVTEGAEGGACGVSIKHY